MQSSSYALLKVKNNALSTQCKISGPNTEQVQLMSRAAAARLWRLQTCAVATAAPPDRSAEL